MTEDDDPFYGIAPGDVPKWVTLGSTCMVRITSLPQPQQDAIAAMVERLRELFTADPFAFDAAAGWVATQMGDDDLDLDDVPIFRHRSEEL